MEKITLLHRSFLRSMEKPHGQYNDTMMADIQQVEARVVLEVSLSKLRANYRKVARAVAPLQVMAILKANAYGLGVRPIAQALRQEGVLWFGVAELREAVEIADIGARILLLGSVLPDEIPAAIAHDFTLPVSDLASARLIDAEAKRQGKIAKGHLAIDSGMGRLGIPIAAAATHIPEIAGLENLKCEGIYSHFPFAYGDSDFSNHQVTALLHLMDGLEQKGIRFAHAHIANSDGIHNIDASRRPPFTIARTGINLYGCFDLEGRQTLPLEPVLSLRSRLVAIRDLPWGASIGYGRTHTLKKPTRVGTVAIGYADGLPLQLSDCGHLSIRGKDCPILGRISMDYTTISLDAIPEAQIGDAVVCLDDALQVGDWAKAKGTIPYEIICSIGNRVKRVYVE